MPENESKGDILIWTPSHRVTKNVHTCTQNCINVICHQMVAETVRRILSTSKNSFGKSLENIWIPYHDLVYGAISIPFSSNTIRSKDPGKATLGMSWNNSRSLLDRSKLRRWDENGTHRAKNRN